MNARQLTADQVSLFAEGREILLNPDLDQLAKAVRKVQARAKKNLLTADQVARVYLRVVKGGESSAHDGLQDCPRSFKFGVSSTVVQAARLTDTLVACSIGRQQVMPGERGRPLVAADLLDDPRQWLKQVVTAFWTALDEAQIQAVQQRAASVILELGARDRWRQHRGHGQAHAGLRRKLQLQALFRSRQPVYVSELKAALQAIAGELAATDQERVTWGAFQRRWPSIAARHKRTLLGLFHQGVASRQALVDLHSDNPAFSLGFTTWTGEQTIFPGPQIVFQVCSPLLTTAGEARADPSVRLLLKSLRELSEGSPHPVTPDTVGWLRVHVDDLQRLVFIDEVQSDVMEVLREVAATGHTGARELAKAWAEWHSDGFSSVRHWARAIGYRVATHSEQSAAAVPDKTRSARKWNVYYGALIRRFGLTLQNIQGYPAGISVDA